MSPRFSEPKVDRTRRVPPDRGTLRTSPLCVNTSSLSSTHMGALYTSGTSTAVASSRLGERRSNCTRSLDVEPSGPHSKRKKKRSPPEKSRSVGGSESLRLPPVTGTQAELQSPRLGSSG